MVSVPRFEIVSGYTDVCPCLFAVSGCYSCFVEDAALQAIAFYWALHGVSAVTWVGAVCVRWVVLAVMSLQYFVVVPFDVGFHIFTAAVADSNSVSVE